MRQENIENITNILIPNVFSDHEVDIITPVINSACDSVCAVSGHIIYDHIFYLIDISYD